MEEHLFRCRPLQPSLLFYQNAESVLWGRNQNPLQECALKQCLSEGVTLLRRISGGGTVYHDHGNLNYSFVLARQAWEPARWVGLIVQALQELGLPSVYACPRHSLWIEERKVSGSAFALSGPAVMLHGCIMLQTNLERLWQLLTPEIPIGEEPGSKTIASVRSPVSNLREFCPNLNVDALIEAICRQVRMTSGETTQIKALEMLHVKETDLRPYRQKFADPTWTLELAKR